MSRFDKIIALLLVSGCAVMAWLLSRSVNVSAFVAAGAGAVLGMLLSPEALQTAKAREVLPGRQGSASAASCASPSFISL